MFVCLFLSSFFFFFCCLLFFFSSLPPHLSLPFFRAGACQCREAWYGGVWKVILGIGDNFNTRSSCRVMILVYLVLLFAADKESNYQAGWVGRWDDDMTTACGMD